MSTKKPEFTPREAAYSIAMGWLRASYQGQTSDVDVYGGTPSYQRQVRAQIAKLHNRMMGEANLDAVPLDETAP